MTKEMNEARERRIGNSASSEYLEEIAVRETNPKGG